MSLDGFIADEAGGYDWIPVEPAIDFGAYLAKIDTLIMGRLTYETAMSTPEGASLLEGMRVVVVSTTIDPSEHPAVEVVSSDVEDAVAGLRREAGRDIWLFGGGRLFRSLLEAGLVDRVEVATMPVLLGAGVPLLPGFEGVATLSLHSSEVFDSGVALMKYDVVPFPRATSPDAASASAPSA
jgi:dihydrofolate reductase